MEKITDKIAALPNGGTYFSLEFFPPKTQMVCDPPICANLLLIIAQGFLQSTRSPRAYVTSAAATLC